MRKGLILGENVKIAENVVIRNNIKIGNNVEIGPFSVINDNVEIQNGTKVGTGVIIGEHLTDYYKDKKYNNPKLVIGKNSIIRSRTIIYAGSVIGDNLQTGNNAIIRENNKIGDFCSIGSNSVVEGECEIGNNCRIHTNVFVCQRSILKNYVWLFPHVVLTNGQCGPCNKCLEGPTIDESAVILAQSMILPKKYIGKNAVVGGKSLVTKDVEEGMLVYGNPAKPIKKATEIRCKSNKELKPFPWKEIVEGYDYPWEDNKE